MPGASPATPPTAPDRVGRGRRGGGIQSFGVVLLVDASSLLVLQASLNTAAMLGVADVLGRSLEALGGDLAECVRRRAQDPPSEVPRGWRCHAGTASREYTVLLHRCTPGEFLLEMEPAGASLDPRVDLQRCIESIVDAPDLAQLEVRAASVFKEITGYDRTLILRFDGEGVGEVVAERRESDIPSCLGQSFADAEIPLGVHARMLRHRLRYLADTEAPPVPIQPRFSPLSGREPDLAPCACRAMSPAHLEFLKRMGVRASLVVSLSVRGRPWGLIVCHHRAPRFLHYERRAVCELLAETVATRILAIEGLSRVQAEHWVRELEARMIDSIARAGDWTPALIEHPQMLLEPLAAMGVALAHEGKWLTLGQVPGAVALAEILAWLDAQPCDGVIATASLRRCAPRLGDLAEPASGLIAVPISNLGGEYLIWFRPECLVGETWSETDRPLGGARVTLPPLMSLVDERRGLIWVRGRSLQWTASDRMAACLFGESIGDVIHQFRSVRLLIAQAQLAQARLRFRMSERLVLIADADGRILLATQAWERLLGARGEGLESLRDFVALCAEPILVEHRISELLREQRPWRGRLKLHLHEGDLGAFMLRADPVFSSPGCLLGFVLILDRLNAQEEEVRAAEAVLDGVMRDQCRWDQGMSATGRGAVYEKLLPTLLENAALAERVADRGHADLPLVTSEEIRDRVARTMDLLERLICYASQSARHERNRNSMS